MKKTRLFSIFRIFLIFLAISLFSVNLFANDWEFGSEGGHAIPLNSSEISIKSEKINFKIVGNKMIVNIKFVFDSPEAGERSIGFITPEGGNDEWDEEDHFKDFKTVVNGKEVKSLSYRLTDLVPKDVKQLEEVKKYYENYDKEKEKDKTLYGDISDIHYSKSYVYFFKANFKKGENVVEHSYSYDGSYGVGYTDYNYVWTTISKWKGKKVDDFELVIEPGNALISLPDSFWKNGKEVDWELVGEGQFDYGYKAGYDREKDKEVQIKMIFAKLKKGYIRYKTKNFSPDDEFYMTHITDIGGNFLFPEKSSKGYIFKNDLIRAVYWADNLTDEELKQFSNEDLKIMRNYPYAVEGYDFTDKKLKEYYSQFFWYIPEGRNVKLSKYDYERIQAVDKIIKQRKK